MKTYVDPLDHLIAGNRRYVAHTTEKDPNVFVDLAKGQAPEILWIGCADSRVPETTVCHCKAGDIFVHRNIANTVHANDLNSASVVEYAVAHLKVKKWSSADTQNAEEPPLRLETPIWAAPSTHGYTLCEKLQRLPSDDARAARVAELNVQQSIEVLKAHPAIRRAINERGLTLHGLIYDIGAGSLKIIDNAAGGKKVNGLWSPK